MLPRDSRELENLAGAFMDVGGRRLDPKRCLAARPHFCQIVSRPESSKTCKWKSGKWDSCSQPSSNSPAGVPQMWGMGNLNELG